MNGHSINWLQLSYPVVLWMLVAFCAFLGFRNVIATSGTVLKRPLSFKQPAMIVSALESLPR